MPLFFNSIVNNLMRQTVFLRPFSACPFVHCLQLIMRITTAIVSKGGAAP
jgi:hypothetical protein